MDDYSVGMAHIDFGEGVFRAITPAVVVLAAGTLATSWVRSREISSIEDDLARENVSASVGWTIILQIFAIVALVVSRSILRTARAGKDGIPSTATSVALVATGGASAAVIVAVLLAGTDLGIPLTLGPLAVVFGVIAVSCAAADMQASRRSVPARL